MALSVACPGCESVYPVGENLLGKSIRCKKCGETITVGATTAANGQAAKRPAVVEDDDEPVSPARTKRPAVTADDDEPRSVRRKRPTPPPSGKSKLPLILAGLVGLLLVGGVAGYMLTGESNKPEPFALQPSGPRGTNLVDEQPDDEDEPNAVRPKPAAEKKKGEKPSNNDAVAKSAPTPKPEAKEPKDTGKEEPKAEPKALANPPAVEKKPEPVVDEPLTRGGGRRTVDNSSQGGMSETDYFAGNISRTTMEAVKRAAVFIRTETDLGKATGSGWFGVAPGLVFTNAHVLGMKAPSSPEPKKLTFFLNAGTPQQREIPHSKLKILAVDREIDLAVIQVLGEKDLPSPLTVKPSADLREGQSVFTIGFPLGYTFSGVVGQSKGEPEVATRKTSYSGQQADKYGQPVRIKIEGGINPGNSGGAIVDAKGNVTGVVVEMFGGGRLGNFIGLGVPTEYVFGLMSGRVSTVEYGLPYRDNGKVKVPVTAHVLNPMDRPVSISVRGWVSDAQDKYRVSAPELPKGEPTDIGEQTIDLNYDTKAKKATGELTLPEAPAGRTYFAQPFYKYTDENGRPAVFRMPGIKVPMNGPPLDRIPANLVAKPKEGQRRASTLTSSADRAEFLEGEGESKEDKVLFKTTLKVNEIVLPRDQTDQLQVARLRMAFQDLNLAVESAGGALDQKLLPEAQREILNDLIKRTEGYGWINRFGEMYRYTVGIPGLPAQLNPLQYLVTNLTEGAMEALQSTSIPMPNKQVSPGDTWTSDKDVRLTLISTEGGGLGQLLGEKVKVKKREYKYRDRVTYTFMGVIERAGKKEAVVKIEGKAAQSAGAKETVTGSLKGIAYVELETGVVIEAEIEKEFSLDTSGEGKKRRFEGLNKYKVNRGSSQS